MRMKYHKLKSPVSKIKTWFIYSAFLFVVLNLINCKSENKSNSKTAELAVNRQTIMLHVSGMTCEIGCAKTIQSKLYKKEGVLAAKVIFVDSIAKIEFNANKVSKKDLVAFINGIAGGKLYNASEMLKYDY